MTFVNKRQTQNNYVIESSVSLFDTSLIFDPYASRVDAATFNK